MSDQDPKEFRTLRGFLDGEEPNEESYFAYSATLRIFGNISSLDEISSKLGLTPSNTHRKGEKSCEGAAPYRHDMWQFDAPVAPSEPLEHHIDALWLHIKPKVEYLRELKHTLSVDVFLGYRTNCDCAGFEIPHTSLELFSTLEIPFGVSVIIA